MEIIDNILVIGNLTSKAAVRIEKIIFFCKLQMPYEYFFKVNPKRCGFNQATVVFE